MCFKIAILAFFEARRLKLLPEPNFSTKWPDKNFSLEYGHLESFWGKGMTPVDENDHIWVSFVIFENFQKIGQFP